MEELNILANTPCESNVLKKAALFSALTGMAYKEMKNLKWGQIEESENFGIRIPHIRSKTKRPNYLNISSQALELLDERKDFDDFVFEELKDDDRYNCFKIWLAQAGIKKKMTFHDLRHTYGTLQYESGTEIYTIQKQMNHKNIKQTEQYAQMSDPLRRKAADAIKITFKKED